MDPESALIAGIAAEPYGCGWLVLADHYEELQDPRHELLRLVYDARYRPELSLPERGERIGELRAAGVQYPWLRFTNSVGIEFAWIPPGHSWLGGGGGQPGTIPFTLDKGLWCGVYPVTQGEWQAVMGDDPSHFSGNARLPVERVSWQRITREFLPRLNRNGMDDGYWYRLPSAEEWEIICRGGPISQAQSAYDYYFARSKSDLTPHPINELTQQLANYGHGLAGRTSEVGRFLPNPLGIYDMHGNVWEWTATSNGTDRVIRGGSWYMLANSCTADTRYSNLPDSSASYLGFRIVADLP